MKLKRVLLFISIFLALTAGGSYLLFIYHPQAYAQAVVPLFEEFQRKIQELDQTSDPALSDAQAAEETFRRIEELKKEIQATQEKLAKLFPPLFGEEKQIHEDFSFLLNTFSLGIEKSQEKLTYSSKIFKVVSISEPEGGTIPYADPQNPKMSDYQNYFGGVLNQVKQLTPEILTQEPSTSSGVSLSELKEAWQEAELAIPVFLNWTNSFDPNRPLGELSSSEFSPPPDVSQAAEKITKFFDLLKKILEGSGLSGSFGKLVFIETEVSQAEIENRTQRLQNAIEKIKTRP